jgi:hypothetical protein
MSFKYIFYFLFILINCSSENTKTIHITVFIHGTVGQNIVFPSDGGLLNLSKKIFNFFRLRLGFIGFLEECIKYRWNINIEKDIIGISLIGKTPGLIDLDINENEISETAKKTLNSYKNIDKIYFNNDEKIKKYYLFNWNGALSIKHRENASKELYDNINKIVEINNNKGFLTKIDIICHSHGGNVALGLAKFAKEKNSLNQIENIFLMGTPIYNFSEHMVFIKNENNEYFFKNIFSLFSEEDKIQTKDITIGYKMYKKFTKQRENLFQISISYWKDNNIFHPTHQEFTYNADKNRKFPVVVSFIPLIKKGIIVDRDKIEHANELNFIYNIDKGVCYLKIIKIYIINKLKRIVPKILRFIVVPYENNKNE